MKLKLYQFATSPFCTKVRKILDYKGLDYEVAEVDYLDRGDLLASSGNIFVPALTLEDGVTIVNSDRIAERLEELYPEPTVFPPEWRGIHLALARYFDTEMEDTLFRAAIPDELEHYARQGPDREAFFRLIRERKYGEGFCDRMVRDRDQSLARAYAMIKPLDDTLRERAFLLGRIGYADFALYSQLCYLTISGKSRIPEDFVNLRAFFDRIDRITSKVEPNS